jgi:hypothetical protein
MGAALPMGEAGGADGRSGSVLIESCDKSDEISEEMPRPRRLGWIFDIG